MAVGLSAAAANALLDTHHDTTYPWIQLHTADPGAAGTTAVAGNAITQRHVRGVGRSFRRIENQ